jgi:SWI/SNF-related matrix-associated actin-dependent regulator 1 of chromatin subfamily A
VELRFLNDRFVLPRALPDGWLRQMHLRHLVEPTWDEAERHWVYDEGEDETKSLRFLRDAYRVPFDFEADERLDRLMQVYNMDDGLERIAAVMNMLRPYQKQGVDFITWNKKVLVADAMGLGKTLEALAAIEKMDAYPALVLAPASVKLGWQQEVLKWLPWRSCQVLMTGKDVLDDVDVLVLNPELLMSTMEDLEMMGFQSIVMDEAHYYKNPDAQRTKIVERLVHDMDIRIALTGTPIPNRRNDILQQLKLLGQLENVLAPYRGVTPHWWDLHSELPIRYAQVAMERLPREEINKRLRDTCMIRRTKGSVGKDLPKFERVRRELPADPRRYAKVEAEFMTWLEEVRKKDEKKLWGDQLFAGRQHLSRLRREAALGKIVPVVEWATNMREAKERVVFFAHHKEVVNRLAKALPGKVAKITGETRPLERRRIVDSFDEYDFLVATMDTMGQGVDGLQWHANHLAFIELDWTPTKHEQCEGRLHRIGQRYAVTAWYFTAADTIEGAMLRTIDAKWRDVEGIVNGRTVDKFVETILTGLLHQGPTSDEDEEPTPNDGAASG